MSKGVTCDVERERIFIFDDDSVHDEAGGVCTIVLHDIVEVGNHPRSRCGSSVRGTRTVNQHT